MDTIKRKNGTETVRVADLQIQDLWHVAMAYKDFGNDEPVHTYDEDGEPGEPFRLPSVRQAERGSEMILEVWHLAHDLLRAVREPLTVEAVAESANDLSARDRETLYNRLAMEFA